MVLVLVLGFGFGSGLIFGLGRGLDLGLGLGLLGFFTLNADFCFGFCFRTFFFFGFLKARPAPFGLFSDKSKKTHKSDESRI